MNLCTCFFAVCSLFVQIINCLPTVQSNVTNESNIQVPTSPPPKDALPSTFIPQVNISACGDRTFCMDVPNYPSDYIHNIIQQKDVTKKFKKLQGEDRIAADIKSRFNVMDTPLCKSITHLEEPKAGRNKNNEWLFLVNHADFKQAVVTEMCITEKSLCSMSENFPHKTECRQKYILRKMLALDPKDGQLKEETIKLPSCCTCRYFKNKRK